MADFELPTSRHVAREHVPPEVDQLCRYLEAAVEVVPDVAPVLSLGAVTGMRRGELVSLRRSRVFPSSGKLRVDAAYASGRRVKATKTWKEREVAIDPDTMEMLLRHCVLMDERAAACGVEVPEDGFVFSLEPDCSWPMEADYVTKQVARLKDHLGIADKRPATIALEDQACVLYRRSRHARPRVGPARLGWRSVVQGDRPSARTQRALGAARRGIGRAARGGGEGRPRGDVRRFDPGAAEVHVQRAARRRVQPVRGRSAPGARAAGAREALRQAAGLRPTARPPTTSAGSFTGGGTAGAPSGEKA